MRKSLSFKGVIISGLILLISGFMCLCGIADGDTTVLKAANWNSEQGIPTSFGDFTGDGSEGAPYEINTAEKLVYLSVQASESSAVLSQKFYKLTADIDLSGRNFTPIGSADKSFQIVDINFDGNNKTINGLTINSTSPNSGLFGYIYHSTVKNLTFTDVSIFSDNINTAAVAGTAASCVFENIVVNGTVESTKNSLGGLVGTIENYENKFISCVNNAAVTSLSGSYTGGIFGSASYGDVTLRDCVNNGTISGVEYVSGIGSGNTNTDMLFRLYGCSNTGGIEEKSPNQKYFAGLIAYAGNSADSVMDFCFNTGSVSAQSSSYIAGLSAFGKFTITNSYNKGAVAGDNIIGGLAGAGTFDISGSYNIGNVTAYNLGTGVAGGIAAKYIGFGTVKTSYNSGAVSAVGQGITGGIIGSFDASEVGGTEPVIVENCYNTGDTENAFIGNNSYNGNITVQNCYDYSVSGTLPGLRITHNYVRELPYTEGVPASAGEKINLYDSLVSNSPAAWSIDSIGGYKDGFPFLNSGLVSKLTIDISDAAASGTYRTVYYNDYLGITDLDFLETVTFTRNGYTFLGLENSDGVRILLSEGAPYNFTHTKPNELLTGYYVLKNYTVSVSTSAEAGTVGIYDGASLIGASASVSLNTQYVLKAEKSTAPDADDFAYWAVEIGTELKQISASDNLALSTVFNEELLNTYPEETSFNFVAVFEKSWEVTVNMTTGSKGWGTLDIVMGGSTQRHNFDNPTFKVPKTDGGSQPTEVTFVLNAAEFYETTALGVGSELGDSVITTGAQGTVMQRTMTVGIKGDLTVDIGFGRGIYYIETASVYADGVETPRQDLLAAGASAGFYIGQILSADSIVANVEDTDGYRFLGFKFKNSDGSGYSNFYGNPQNGQIGGLEINAEFLQNYFVEADNKIYAVAVFKKQYMLDVRHALGSGEYGNIEVFVDGSAVPYRGEYFDENDTNIKVIITPNTGCSIAGINVNGQLYTGEVPMNFRLTKDTDIEVALEKTRYYIDLYTIDNENNIITVDTENLNIADSLQDTNGNYLTYDEEIYIQNNKTLENRNNMKFAGWYYMLPDGSLAEINSDADGNLRTAIKNGELDGRVWYDENGVGHVTIVAKITNIYLLNVDLSNDQSLRGDYKIETWNGSQYTETPKTEVKFNVGARVRLTVTPKPYFEFDRLDVIGGNMGVPEVTENGTVIYEIELLSDFSISVYFKTLPVGITFNDKTGGASGNLTYSNDKKQVSIGDTIEIGFTPDTIYQVSSFTINGKSLNRIRDEYGARVIGNSVIIKVNEELLNWIKEDNGELEIAVSTQLSTMFVIILGGLAVFLVAAGIMTSILAVNGRKRKKQMKIWQAQHESARKRMAATAMITNLTKEAQKGE